MEFFETVEKRKSIRIFLNKEIDNKILDTILKTITLAPSAGNLQSYRIILIKNEKLKRAVAEGALRQQFIAEAPIALVFLADSKRSLIRYGERGDSLYAIQDATIAAAYTQLAVTALGLGSVWVGAFEQEKVAKLIGAADYEIPITIIPIGYSVEKPERHERRKLSEIVKEL